MECHSFASRFSVSASFRRLSSRGFISPSPARAERAINFWDIPAASHATLLATVFQNTRYAHLTDGTVEGLRHETKPVFCVQYHPEAAPGPHDADYLFRQFLDVMEARG